jgi:hypothetical protein
MWRLAKEKDINVSEEEFQEAIKKNVGKSRTN